MALSSPLIEYFHPCFLPLIVIVLVFVFAFAPLFHKVLFLQHGYRHVNHAPAGEKSMEFGAHRPLARMGADLARGKALIAGWPHIQLVLVPPWNRIDAALIARLHRLGFAGLSGFGERSGARAAGLAVVNTHIDIIDWRGGRVFRGAGPILTAICTHLARRRTGITPDPDEPTGILTHHLLHGEQHWRFLARLFDELTGHPAAFWPDVARLFATAEKVS